MIQTYCLRHIWNYHFFATQMAFHPSKLTWNIASKKEKVEATTQ